MVGAVRSGLRPVLVCRIECRVVVSMAIAGEFWPHMTGTKTWGFRMGDGSFNSAADRGRRAGEFIDKSPGQMGPRNRVGKTRRRYLDGSR